MNETKVNTNNGDVTSPDTKKALLPPDCVGSIPTPYGTQLINRGDAVDHAAMRGRQLTSLLLLIQGDNSERFCCLGPGSRDSLLWLAIQLSEEMEAMVEMIVEDVQAKCGGAQ